jgi:hypothetical protein
MKLFPNDSGPIGLERRMEWLKIVVYLSVIEAQQIYSYAKK